MTVATGKKIVYEDVIQKGVDYIVSMCQNIDNIDNDNLNVLINKKDSKNDYNLFYSDTISDIVKNLKPENNDSLKELINCVGNEGGKTLSQYLVKDIIKSVTPNNKKVLTELLNFKTDNGHFFLN